LCERPSCGYERTRVSESVIVQLTAIVVLAVVAQWLAWRLRVPAILLLLLTGLAAGPGTGWLARHGWLLHRRLLDPNQLFGDLLLPAVSLAVALILFEGGLTLNLRDLRPGGRVIWRLVTFGAIVTGVVAALAARYVAGLDLALSVLVGAVLTVTGPTVIGPLLRHVRPIGPVGPILKWEGIIIDPIGAMLAVVVFELIVSGPMRQGTIAWIGIKTLVVGTATGLAAAGALLVLLRRRTVPDHLHTSVTLMLVVLAFAGGNAMQHESGLFAVIAMGIALTNQRRVDLRHVAEFEEQLTLLMIGILFIVLGSRLNTQQIAAALTWRAGAFIAVLILVARPLAVLVCTAGTPLRWRERAFLAAMAPRGIVAAAVASVFALRLHAIGYPGADQIVPLIFASIFGTVLVYGLTARTIARRLGLSRPERLGFLIAGADAFARRLARFLADAGFDVLLVDTNRDNIVAAGVDGLPAAHQSVLLPETVERVELTSIGRLLALTPSGEVHALAALQVAPVFGRVAAYQLPSQDGRRREPSPAEGAPAPRSAGPAHGRILFGPDATHARLAALLAAGAVIQRTAFTSQFTYDQFRAAHPDAVPLLVMNDRGGIEPVTAEAPPRPRPGEAIVSLLIPTSVVPPPPPREAGPVAVEHPATAEAKQA
jgi:NhaP-type Na+/H+ or K+/H+ antiporter